MKRHCPAVRTVRLTDGQTVAVRVTRGICITVDSGLAWLTVERDERDFVLPAGRVFTCDADDVLVVVQMLAAGSLSIAPAGKRPAVLATLRHNLFDRLRGALWPAPATTCDS